MSDVDEIVAAVPIQDVASRLGVDAATAEQATRTLIPTLLAGLEANAADPAGAASLESALQQHDGGLVQGGANLDDIDTDDGERIVANIFGQQKDAVVSTLADAPGAASLGGSNGLLPKLLPILAPIVLSWLAKKYSSGSGGGGGGIGDILGSVLGGAAGGASAGGTAAGGGAGGGLGDVLGSILGGGGGSGSSGGGIADILGGLLGGGKR